MKIAVIGGKSSIETIQSLEGSTAAFAELTYIQNADTALLPGIVEECQKNYDGILFTGTTPFEYASRHVVPRIPWEFLPRNPISLLCALLKAGYVNHHDITRMSVDSYTEATVRDIYSEIGITGKKLFLYTAPFEPFLPGYRQKVLDFHTEHYKNGLCRLCLTGLDTVKEGLEKRKIPCIKVNPSSDIILEKINRLRLRHAVLSAEDSETAILAVSLDFFGISGFYGINEIDALRSRNAAKETIYAYGQRMGSAVMETSDRTFLLVTTKKRLDDDMENYKNLNLFRNLLSHSNIRRVYGAVGFGTDSRTAQMNAFLALEKAKDSRESCVYLAYEENRCIGPIPCEPTEQQVRGSEKINKHLAVIADSTGLGYQTLQKLEAVLARHAIEITTSADLAALMELAPRSINRILNKLEKGGYAEVVGLQSSHSSGRPRRLYRFHLNR